MIRPAPASPESAQERRRRVLITIRGFVPSGALGASAGRQAYRVRRLAGAAFVRPVIDPHVVEFV